jgi:hypothetical protein
MIGRRLSERITHQDIRIRYSDLGIELRIHIDATIRSNHREVDVDADIEMTLFGVIAVEHHRGVS